MFAKKRNATAAAPSKVTTSINANANVNGAGQKFSPIRNTNAVMNNNSAVAAAVEHSSVANLSRFDTDLMSKNTENAAVVDDSCVNVGGGNDGNEKHTEEVPKSIPTSGGDDVEDDLTEATAATFAMDVGEEVEVNDVAADKEPSATSKGTSPYFSNNAVTNNQMKMMENQLQKGNDEKAGTAADDDATKTTSSPATNGNMEASKSNSNSPPREELVIPAGISAAANANNVLQQQQFSPKLGGNMKPTPPVETAKTNKSMPTTTGRTLSPHQGSAINRVSLSPRPPNAKNGRGSSLSPKGTSRPSNHNVNQTTSSFSPKRHVDANVDDDDDNSIVIPGVPAAVANKQQPAARTTLQATNNNVTLNNASVGRGGANNIRQPGLIVNSNNGNTRTTLPTKTPAKNGSRISATLPRPLLNRQQRTSSFMVNKNTMSTSNACDIVTEKVTFAVPDTRPQVVNQNTTMNGNGNKNDRRNGHVAGTSLVNSARAMNSTAITPDNRRGVGVGVGEAKQTAAASTPYDRQTSGGDSSSSGSSSNGSNGTCGNNDNAAVTPTLRPNNNQVSTAKTPYKQPNDNMMDVELQIKEVVEAPQPQRRPRSQTITSPPSASTKNPVESATPRVSNVNPPPSTNVVTNTNAQALAYTTNSNSAFHTDETFDELLSQFVDDIREGTDIYEKGKNDLLKLDVDLTHAHAAVLQYRDGYKNLLDEMEGIQAMAESIMAEL